MKPTTKPNNPNFSSGPCAKRPNWSLDALKDAALGRSHRSKLGKNKLKEVIDRSRKILNIPSDYRIGIVPASDTGAVEMVMWSMLGARGVDVLAWESFGSGWAGDCQKQLKLEDLRVFESPYGQIPQLSQADWNRDVIFTWNGTTSGACVPNANWIAQDRKGLAICDATSAVFAMDIDFNKLDVVTWSWQKAMGGEGAHGMLVLSPRAVERLESYKPNRPLPKIFQMTKGGKLMEDIFEGSTINTPSMLCVEDAIDALKWFESIGGNAATIKRSQDNLNIIENWVAKSNWCDFLVADKSIRSCTSVCLKIKGSWYESLSDENQQNCAKQIVSLLEKEGVAYDIGAYRDAPAGLRIWCGATVEASDIQELLPWLDWAYEQAKSAMDKQAA